MVKYRDLTLSLCLYLIPQICVCVWVCVRVHVCERGRQMMI